MLIKNKQLNFFLDKGVWVHLNIGHTNWIYLIFNAIF